MRATARHLPEERSRGAAISGKERNHLWFNRGGEEFVEVSAVSGLDHVGDSRTWALIDFDRDGLQDVALVNANSPLLNLYRNRLGDRAPGRMIAVRFVGGNVTADPASP